MAWPSANRQIQGKSKLNVQVQWDYPVPTEGAVTSASLYKKGDRFHWTEITADDGRRLRPQGSRTQVFPSTSAYRYEAPIKSIAERAEASAKFLRKVYPEIDVSAGLIRDQITLDAQVLRDRYFFDPVMGNTLETIRCNDSARNPAAFLAFPMGESNSELNVSPFVYPRSNAPIFKPIAKPTISFSTPILQITTPNSGIPFRREDSFFAVRTMGITSLLSIQSDMSADSLYPPRITEMSQISPSEVGSRPIVDVQLSYSSPENVVLALNDRGSIYQWSAGQGSKTVHSIYVSPECSAMEKVAQPCKLVTSDHSSLCYVVSSAVVRQFDLRTHTCVSDLWTTNTQHALITCAEMPNVDTLTRIVTTKEVLWLDPRYPGKPLLGIKHGRQFDQTLEIRTAEISSTPQSFLTSKRTGLISVYDVSRAQDKLVHVNVQPYCLSPVTSHQKPNIKFTSHTIFQHSTMRDSDVKIFQLSPQGSIYHLGVTLSDELENHDSLRGEEPSCQWNESVKHLHAKATGMGPDLGPLAAREHSDVNFQPAYNHCFIHEQEEPGDTEAVYDVLEKMSFFWKDPDVLIDHVLTTFDVAFRSGEEPVEASRADFLTGGVINGNLGFRALMKGRLDTQFVPSKVPWHRNITSILQPIIPGISDDVQALMDRLKSHDLADEDDRTPESLKREADACEQLTLDLVLSTNIYSGKVFSMSRQESLEEALKTMSLAASALSLNGDPPPVHFGFFCPVLKNAVNHYAHSDQESQSGEQEEVTPLGVRLLLNEWTVGVDPEEYSYEDPYTDEDRAKPVVTESVGAINQKPRILAPSQTQRPPLVVTAAPPPIITTRPDKKTGVERQDVTFRWSQGHIGADEQESSQNIGANTQPVAGPFGSRQGEKKRPGKKRIGGF